MRGIILLLITAGAAAENISEVKKEGNIYRFTITKPATVSVEAGRFGNSSGRCREFVPLSIQVIGDANVKEIRIEIRKPTLIEDINVICRAMPQTIASGTLDIAPGSYWIENKDVKRVRLSVSP